LGKPENQEQRELLYWSFYEGGMGQALRTRDWKLVEQPYRTPARLYRINDDSKEQNDLANEHPDLVRKLREKMSVAYEPGEGPWVLRPSKKAQEATGSIK
jgi:arylsulfatase